MNTIFDPAAVLREDLKTLEPYEAPVFPGLIKMDANENPYEFPAGMMDEIVKTAGAQAFNRYPDGAAVELRDRLAVYTGVSRDNIMVGNGSDELIFNIMLAFAFGAKLAVVTPTFSMYGVHGRIAAAEVIESPRLANFDFSPAEVLEAAAKPGVKVVVLCNPNNPTGNAADPGLVEEILKNTNSLVVVDEAYGEFGGETCLPLLDDYPNLVILRTFSKAFGLAGLRVGYLLAARPVVEALWKVKQPYNLNAFSQAAALVVLENPAPFQARIKQIIRDRERLFAAMTELPGVETYPSQANFIMFRTLLPAVIVYKGLLRRGVLIRNLDSPALRDCLRVTVGTPEENKVLLESLRELLARDQ